MHAPVNSGKKSTYSSWLNLQNIYNNKKIKYTYDSYKHKLNRWG